MSNDLPSQAEHLEHILDVLDPGEKVTYSELLRRLKWRGHNTTGIGARLGNESPIHHRGVITSWREPVWDDEVEGGWTTGTLWIARRPE